MDETKIWLCVTEHDTLSQWTSQGRLSVQSVQSVHLWASAVCWDHAGNADQGSLKFKSHHLCFYVFLHTANIAATTLNERK